ncbi:CAP domain-containing protein [candidate division KSB1 bacterium]|nr:CAP domain-containing protein [candidate division KSB1 bacterium]
MLNTEKKIHQLINQYRSSINLPTLELDEKISQLAREHSEAMANKKLPFGNGGFKERTRKIALFLPYQAASENVAAYQGNPISEELVVQFWLKSAKHRKTIKGDYNLTGIGIAKDAEDRYYITQIFIRES